MHLNYLNLTKFELFNKVPVEECIDELQETPFLVDTEQCEDVPKLVCTEVSFDIYGSTYIQIYPSWSALRWEGDISIHGWWKSIYIHIYSQYPHISFHMGRINIYPYMDPHISTSGENQSPCSDWGASPHPSVQDYRQAKDTHRYRQGKVGSLSLA